MSPEGKNSKVRELISAIGAENRLTVLQLLESQELTIPQIRRGLAKLGEKKPYITVNRYMDSLRELGLVESSTDGHFYLTIKGLCIRDSILELERRLKTLDKLESLQRYSIKGLPHVFRANITLLEKATHIEDPFTLCSEMEKSIILSEHSIHLICSQYSKSLSDAIITKAIGGTVSKIKIIKDKWQLGSAIDCVKQILSSIPEPEKDDLMDKLLFRVYHEIIPLCLLLCDDKKVFISFPPRYGSHPSFQSGYVSEDKELINYGREIFRYYWNRLECLKIVSFASISQPHSERAAGGDGDL